MSSGSQLILASASPRRAELLHQLGLDFITHPVDIDESGKRDETPRDWVKRLACEKAVAAANDYPQGAVLGSDTMVVLAGRSYGKPADESDAREMLRSLSGKTHHVLSAVALVYEENQQSIVQCSDVTFRELVDEEIADYWATGEPADKAGAYAIQGQAARFITRLEGSYSGVMGLPLYETAELLNVAGFRL